MCLEDFGGAELPPEDLASLGSKRIADPGSLKIFTTLKARAFNYLDRHGIRFMSGWDIPEDKAGDIIDELIRIREAFLQEKEAFLAYYDLSIEKGRTTSVQGCLLVAALQGHTAHRTRQPQRRM